MRALSIRQPWAWLIVNGFKDIENRDWETFYRGQVLVHAGLTMPLRYYDEVQQWVGEEFNIQLPDPAELQRGGIVGVMTITGCVRESASVWFQPGGFGFQLRDARPLPFHPCKGRLQFFDVPGGAGLLRQAGQAAS
jgi:hypothetical protein